MTIIEATRPLWKMIHVIGHCPRLLAILEDFTRIIYEHAVETLHKAKAMKGGVP